MPRPFASSADLGGTQTLEPLADVMGAPTATRPTPTFSGTLTTDFGGDLDPVCCGHGHTEGDAAAWQPRNRIPFAGDLDQPMSEKGWPAAVEMSGSCDSPQRVGCRVEGSEPQAQGSRRRGEWR